MLEDQAVLDVRGLSFRFGKLEVWRDVDMTVLRGQIALLTGLNGAGKTTLLRCLAGWSPPTAGEIRIAGTLAEPSKRGWRARLAFVSDTPPFYDDLTAEEHIRFVLQANRRVDREPYAHTLLARFGLSTQLGAYPSSYSRGMRYKLALAMAFALQPDVLLLDEPFGPLDVDSGDLLAQELRRIASEGAGIVLSGHQLPASLTPDLRLYLEDARLRVVDVTIPASEPA